MSNTFKSNEKVFARLGGRLLLPATVVRKVQGEVESYEIMLHGAKNTIILKSNQIYNYHEAKKTKYRSSAGSCLFRPNLETIDEVDEVDNDDNDCMISLTKGAKVTAQARTDLKKTERQNVSRRRREGAFSKMIAFEKAMVVKPAVNRSESKPVGDSVIWFPFPRNVKVNFTMRGKIKDKFEIIDETLRRRTILTPRRRQTVVKKGTLEKGVALEKKGPVKEDMQTIMKLSVMATDVGKKQQALANQLKVLDMEAKAMMTLADILCCLIKTKFVNAVKGYFLVDKLGNFQFSPITLVKYPEILHTVSKLRYYYGNVKDWHLSEKDEAEFLMYSNKIRKRASELWTVYRKILLPPPDGQAVAKRFEDIFADKVRVFEEKTKTLSALDILSMTSETDNDSFQKLFESNHS